MKRTEKDLHISSFHLNFAVKCKKTAHKCCNFQKNCLSLPCQLRKTGNIEEIYYKKGAPCMRRTHNGTDYLLIFN